MNLTEAQVDVLCAMLEGSILKSCRYLDGTKVYRLRTLENSDEEAVDGSIVEELKAQGLISSNMKFPAATYLLSARGAEIAASLTDSTSTPLTSR